MGEGDKPFARLTMVPAPREFWQRGARSLRRSRRTGSAFVPPNRTGSAFANPAIDSRRLPARSRGARDISGERSGPAAEFRHTGTAPRVITCSSASLGGTAMAGQSGATAKAPNGAARPHLLLQASDALAIWARRTRPVARGAGGIRLYSRLAGSRSCTRDGDASGCAALPPYASCFSNRDRSRSLGERTAPGATLVAYWDRHTS